jgi:twitching motility protein PilT
MLQELLKTSLTSGASDVHVLVGMPPLLRIHTELVATDFPIVTEASAETMVREMIDERRYEKLQEVRDLDFSTKVAGLGRFRVNAHYQRESLAIAFRAISDEVPPLESLNLPPVVQKFVDMPRGLILVTGETGSGKSTTLASLINEINHRVSRHVITLEDPVEYELRSDRCVIEQREVGGDVPSFSSGLKHVLRQDPDIILVGEMRDLETTSAAITAAETGHLVLSTLHTNSAAQTIERIIDIYPAGQQNQIRAQLSNTLQAVVTQTLFKRIDSPGMIPATEIMICNSAVRNCIREARVFEIPNIIETNRGLGMVTLDNSIKNLYFNGHISREDAVAAANRPDKLEQALSA